MTNPTPLRPLGRPIPTTFTPGINHTWCNPYGSEGTRGPQKYLGADVPQGARVTQWHCDNHATIRARMQCEHGHTGQIMDLCAAHFAEFKLKDMTFCPTCNRTNDHKCYLTLTEIS